MFPKIAQKLLRVGTIILKIKFVKEVFLVKKFLTALLSALMIFTLTACGTSEEKNSAETSTPVAEKEFLVAYFSATGTTKTLAENVAEVLGADLYEIKPAVPYTTEDLNWRDETTRATVEQRDEKFRTELADKDAKISDYKNIIVAFPIWWGVEPRIIDTFIESYDFSGKIVIPICTSGGSDIGSSGDNLKALAPSANFLQGKSFMKNVSKDEIKNYFNSLGL